MLWLDQILLRQDGRITFLKFNFQIFFKFAKSIIVNSKEFKELDKDLM